MFNLNIEDSASSLDEYSEESAPRFESCLNTLTLLNPSRIRSALWISPNGPERVLLYLGVGCAISVGVLPPLGTIAIGMAVTAAGMKDVPALNEACLNLLILAVAGFFVSSISTLCLEGVANRQARRVQLECLNFILSQELAYWDTHDSAEFVEETERMSAIIRDGSGRKLGAIFQYPIQVLSGCGIALGFSWQLSLVMSAAAAVALLQIGLDLKKSEQKIGKNAQDAEAVVRQAIPKIRVIAAFGLEDHFLQDFFNALDSSFDRACSAVHKFSLFEGSLQFLAFSSYGIAWWYASYEVRQKWLKHGFSGPDAGGTVVTVFLSMLFSTAALGLILPNISALVKAVRSAEAMRARLLREPRLDAADVSVGAEVPENVDGRVEFRDVSFSYPGSGNQLYNRLSFEVAPGETVALVGKMGSGKSTILKLLQRLYDPDGGAIFLDGRNIRQFQLQSLRDHMGYIEQNPQLFSETVAVNIALGKRGLSRQRDILEAARAVGVHRTIRSLPFGYNTVVGPAGCQKITEALKRRISLARVMLRNPTILLVDEPTDALDHDSELLVRRSLTRLLRHRKRTTIIVPTRVSLAAVAEADRIIVLHDPDGTGTRVVEEGRHQDLISHPNGYYRTLLAAGETFDTIEGLELQDCSISSTISAGELSEPTKYPIQKTLHMLSAPRTEEGSLYTQDPQESQRVAQPPSKSLWYLGEVEHRFSFSVLCKETLRSGWVFFAGVFSSLIKGALPSVAGILIATFVVEFFDYDAAASAQVNSYALSFAVKRLTPFFVLLAVMALISGCFVLYSFEIVGLQMKSKFQKSSFEQLIHQDMEFFDADQNTVITISSVIFRDCGSLYELISKALPMCLQYSSTLTAVIIVCLCTNRRVGLISLLGFIVKLPVDFLRHYIVHRTRRHYASTQADRITDLMCEELVNKRQFIASYGLQTVMLDMYRSYLRRQMTNEQKISVMSALTLGLLNSLCLSCIALAFWYGGSLLHDTPGCSVPEIFRIVFVLILSGGAIGNPFTWMGIWFTAKESLRNIEGLLNRQSRADSRNEGGCLRSLKGCIDFDRVTFRYTHDPGIQVLSDVTMHVEGGEIVVLIGRNSAAISQLLERFYDVGSISPAMHMWFTQGRITETLFDRNLQLEGVIGGEIRLDGTLIEDINLRVLRQCIGYVPKGAKLFRSWDILENILLRRRVCEDELSERSEQWERVRALCMLDDIASRLPAGFATVVEANTLSWAESHCVALARALLRDPSVVIIEDIFHGATSAACVALLYSVLHNLLEEARKRRRYTVLFLASPEFPLTNLGVSRCFVLGPNRTGGGSVFVSGTTKDMHTRLLQSYNQWR